LAKALAKQTAKLKANAAITTYPFEKWWYRHIEGIGDDIEIMFADPAILQFLKVTRA